MLLIVLTKFTVPLSLSSRCPFMLFSPTHNGLDISYHTLTSLSTSTMSDVLPIDLRMSVELRRFVFLAQMAGTLALPSTSLRPSLLALRRCLQVGRSALALSRRCHHAAHACTADME